MKKAFISIACMLTVTNIVYAQTNGPRIGYINSVTLLRAMPEKAKADSDLARYAKSFQDQMDLMTKEYQTDVKRYQANEKTMTDAVKEVKGKEIQDLQNRIEGIQQSAQDKIQQKKADLWEPIGNKMNNAIKALATEKNYDFIFDAANGNLVYEKEEFDITNLLKDKMGVK